MAQTVGGPGASSQRSPHRRSHAQPSELRERRNDELMALAAILPEGELVYSGEGSSGGSASPNAAAVKQCFASAAAAATSTMVSLTVPIVLPQPTKVTVRTHVFGISPSSVINGTSNGSSTRGARSGNKQAQGRSPSDFHHSDGHGADEVDSSRQLAHKGSYDRVSPRSGMGQCAPSEYTELRIETTSADSLLYLPPVKMLIRLPEGYPDHEAPTILHIEAPFLSALHLHESKEPSRTWDAAMKKTALMRSSSVQSLRRKLLGLYEDVQGEILWTWYDTIREGIWAEMLDGSNSNDLPFSVEGVEGPAFEEVEIRDHYAGQKALPSRLLNTIRTHDMICRRKEFEGERFGCGICLEEKRGTRCWRIGACRHVFCQDCLSDYLSSMIREGYHRQASACPDPECVEARAKADATVDVIIDGGADTKDPERSKETPRQSDVVGAIEEAELVKLVGQALADRLHELQDRAAASTDPRSGYCPRPACGRLVRGDPKDVGTAYEAMRQCACGYTYCQFCDKAWHGRNHCDTGSSHALVEAYKTCCSSGYHEKRREMELKYGRANLERMVRMFDEEQRNKAWLESNSQSCPLCEIRINRSHGCAHMTCKRCNTHFCYRCGTRLDPAQPYRHFNTPGQPCYMRLFELEAQEGAVQRAQDDEDAVLAALALE